MRTTGAGREQEGGAAAAAAAALEAEEAEEEGRGRSPSPPTPPPPPSAGHFSTWRDPLNPRLELDLTAVRASKRGLEESGRGGRLGPEEGEALTT